MDEAAGPAVVWANWYRFRARERIHHERVMSVCYLWSLGGTGTVRSQGRSFALDAGAVLRLPWGHDVEYVADGGSPFRLGTVHVVPRYGFGDRVLPVVAHQPGDPLHRASDRSGDPGTPVFSPGSSVVAQRIASLGRYAVERFDQGAADESVLRALGALFVAEAVGAAGATGTTGAAGGVSGVGLTDGAFPRALETMTAFVTRNLDRQLSVADVAAAGNCSVSTAGRLFAAHLGTSVSAWVRGARMREASEMLRTSGLRVGEVARAVGFTDQLYFSRVFRNEYGVPPSRYGHGRIRP